MRVPLTVSGVSEYSVDPNVILIVDGIFIIYHISLYSLGKEMITPIRESALIWMSSSLTVEISNV